jgi:hypothetical protein
MIDRIQLFLSSWVPSEIYFGAAILFIAAALIVSINSLIHFFHTGKYLIDLFSIPIFVSLYIFTSSLLILLTGELNTLICVIGILVAFFLTYRFLLLPNEIGDSSELLLSRPIEAKKRMQQSWFFLSLLFLVLFYLLSIDHNYLPAQYDITTYQFFSDLVARHGTYPDVRFADDYELHILPPPGYFGIDYVVGFFWANPRRVLLTSTLFLFCVTLAFIRLGTVLFNDIHLEPFFLFATFCRGLYWNYWEFNVQRELSLLASLMFLICIVLSYRGNSEGKRLHYLIFGQLFLATAFMCHPENTAYILVGVFTYIGLAYALKKIKKEKNTVNWAVYFFGSTIISLSIFLFWYVSVVRQTPRNFLTAEISSPVPEVLNLLFHTNGFVPVVLFGIGLILMYLGNRRKESFFFFFLFFSLIFLAYFKYFLHLILPEVYQLVEREYTQFDGASLYVIGPYVHPHAIIVKITALWWFMILVSGWVYSYLWDILRGMKRLIKVCIFLLFIPLVFGDVFYLYYNQPIIDKDEYQFLLSLKKKLPDDAIIIAPAQYYFSAWTGPVLQRDSLSSRSYYHSTNSIAPDLYQILEVAYSTGNFESLLCSLAREKVVVLFDKARAEVAVQLIHSDNWKTVLVKNGNYALSWGKLN